MNEPAWTGCGLASWGVVRIPWNEMPRWRKNPGPAEGLQTSALKLADEQAVLAVAALLQAAERAGWAADSFRAWGVLAAPRYLGRARIAHVINRFQKLGVRSISPLAIPCLSQHAVASGVGMFLGSHGPTFGIGGGSAPLEELLLNSLSVFAGQPCPGVWALLTGWEPECIPDTSGQVANPATGLGIALALTPQTAAGEIRLLKPAGERGAPSDASPRALADFLTEPAAAPSWRCALSGGGVLEVIPSLSAALPLRRAG